MEAQERRCQAASINACTEFSSNAFEEFGLTKVYALVTPICDSDKRSSGPEAVEGGVYTFGYQIFKESTCEGTRTRSGREGAPARAHARGAPPLCSACTPPSRGTAAGRRFACAPPPLPQATHEMC